MDELLLSLGWCTAAFLVYTGTSRTHKPFSKCWAHFSVFCALISFIGVILNIMRVVNFRQFMIPASVVIGLLYLILMPIWGIALGVQLKNRSDPAGMYQSDVSASVDVEIGNTGEAGPRA